MQSIYLWLLCNFFEFSVLKIHNSMQFSCWSCVQIAYLIKKICFFFHAKDIIAEMFIHFTEEQSLKRMKICEKCIKEQQERWFVLFICFLVSIRIKWVFVIFQWFLVSWTIKFKEVKSLLKMVIFFNGFNRYFRFYTFHWFLIVPEEICWITGNEKIEIHWMLF